MDRMVYAKVMTYFKLVDNHLFWLEEALRIVEPLEARSLRGKDDEEFIEDLVHDFEDTQQEDRFAEAEQAVDGRRS